MKPASALSYLLIVLLFVLIYIGIWLFYFIATSDSGRWSHSHAIGLVSGIFVYMVMIGFMLNTIALAFIRFRKSATDGAFILLSSLPTTAAILSLATFFMGQSKSYLKELHSATIITLLFTLFGWYLWLKTRKI